MMQHTFEVVKCALSTARPVSARRSCSSVTLCVCMGTGLPSDLKVKVLEARNVVDGRRKDERRYSTPSGETREPCRLVY